MIAARLSERAEHQVTLLESGPDYPTVQELPVELRDGRHNASHLPGAPHDWGYRFRPSSQRPNVFAFPRGRVVGGSSAVNTCIALRGHPYDYDDWAALGLTEWSFEACLPAFKRLEHDLDFTDEWHGKGGPIPVRRHPESELTPWQAAFFAAARRVGYPATVDHNNPELPCGVGPHAMNKIGGERMSAARCYLTPTVRKRDNLAVMGDVHARRVLFENGGFAGLEVERGGATEVLRADRVVLAGGAIGSLGVLLRSGVGPKDELTRLGVTRVVDSPMVGRRLLDHPGTAVLFAPRGRIEVSLEHPLIQIMARASSLGSPHPFDLQLQPGSFLPVFGLELPVLTIMAPVGRPDGHGTIRFPSADPHARPIIEARFLDHPGDRAKLEEAIDRIWEIARQPELRDLAFPVYPDRSVLASRDRLRAFLPKITGSGYHPCGTLPMSARGIEHGAVDGRGRVHGVRGVLVADASVFPIIPSANTNLPTLMVGERVGEWLKGGMDF